MYIASQAHILSNRRKEAETFQKEAGTFQKEAEAMEKTVFERALPEMMEDVGKDNGMKKEQKTYIDFKLLWIKSSRLLIQIIKCIDRLLSKINS